MREWRIGTITMGIAIIILGVLLLISQFKGLEFLDSTILWLPIIFILLGIEILLFLFLSQKENVHVRYDIFSILIVGMIGFVGLGFTVLTSTGIMEEVRYAVASVEYSQPVPELRQDIPEDVKRIVIQGPSYRNRLKVEETTNRELLLFGEARITEPNKGKQESTLLNKLDQLYDLRQSGDTLYLSFYRLPERNGLVHSNARYDITLVLPEDLEVKMDGE